MKTEKATVFFTKKLFNIFNHNEMILIEFEKETILHLMPKI